MVKQRHLENAPIVEALVDIRVKLPEHIDVTALRQIHALISGDYPKEQKSIRSNIKFEVGKSSPEAPTQDTCPYGYRYTSTDGKQIMQARLDGFTFSRLTSYESWEKLREEAYRLWQLYAKVTTPELITRVALRYINRLKIPLSLKNFNEYITAPPFVPGSLPQGLASFLTRVVVPIPDSRVTAIITQALEPVITDTTSVILDIDVFDECLFNADGVEAWESIENLREVKNKFFFESITEEMAKICE